MGIRNWRKVARDQKKWRKTELEAKVQNGLQCLKRRNVDNLCYVSVIFMESGLHYKDMDNFFLSKQAYRTSCCHS